MPLVITDSTALISLDRIGQLALLPAVFPHIIAPPAVVREFGECPVWLDERAVRAEHVVRAIRAQLDEGEAEAIALALEHPGSLLLMDERRGRQYARTVGLAVVGTFGFLIAAKRRGHIRAVRPVLDALIAAGFHASKTLYNRALEQAGER